LVSFCLFESFLPTFRLLQDQNRRHRHFYTVQDNESAKKVAKRCNKGEKEEMFGNGPKFSNGATFSPGAKFILVLHLTRCQLNVINVPHFLLNKLANFCKVDSPGLKKPKWETFLM